MDKKKYPRVNFRISHCSTQEPQYPVSQLLLQSADARGWQSKRFSNFPQTIIIQLIEPTVLKQVSLLSHQSKIAKKIQIQCKIDQSRQWKKLGYVSLSSNQNTNFQARQLRTANINSIPATILRFTFRENYSNAQNVFNQVGLISLSVFGERMTQSSESTYQIQSKKAVQFDKTTLAKLKQLQVRKAQAVQNEQYDKAKQIKDQIQRIKNLGQALLLLQQKKQQAVKNQLYEEAKIINENMKKLREQNEQQSSNIGQKPQKFPNQLYKVRQKKPGQEHYKKQQSFSPVTPINKQRQIKQIKPQIQNIQKSNPMKTNIKQQYSQDRPLDIKNKNQPEEYEKQQIRQGGQLQPLNKQIYQECSAYFPQIQQQTFRYIFSKDHVNRQNGIRIVREKLSMRIGNRQLLAQACLFVIKNTIDDRIGSIQISAIELMDQMMRKLKPPVSSSNLQYAQYILEKLADNLGHTNQKIKGLTQSLYSNFPVYHLTSKDLCYKVLSMLYKRDKPPKILTGRLKMISKIISEYQLGKSFQDIINYAVKYVDDKNNQIRNAAISVICAISSQIGYNQMKPYLKNIRPQIIKTIQQKLDETGGGEQQKNYDQKPIKTTNKQKQGSKSRKQFQQVQNQFIQIPKNKNQNENHTCPYCLKHNQKFQIQDYLDLHFFHQCPMIAMCQQCGQAIQISYLTAHQVGECKNSKYFKKCPRCKQAVHQKIYKVHVQKKECLPAKPPASANRCPLCHLDTNPGIEGWRKHLLEEGCQNNPRK